jgi:cytochrome c
LTQCTPAAVLPLPGSTDGTPARRDILPAVKGALLLVFLLCLACRQEEVVPVKRHARGGDPVRGKILIEQYGCHACHAVPGVEGPRGMLGPPLEHMAKRVLIAEKVPNTPDNMVRYLQDPHTINPEGTMPDLNVTPADAQDLTAFLARLD